MDSERNIIARSTTEGHENRDFDYEYVPEHLAQGLGIGIENALSPSIKALTSPLGDSSLHTPDNAAAISVIQEAMGSIFQTIDQLKSSTETRIIRENGGFNFSFSEESQVLPPLEDGVRDIPAEILDRVKGAVLHNLGNKFSLLGYYRYIQNPSLPLEQQEEHSERITAWLREFQRADAIQLETSEGKTHILLKVDQQDADSYDLSA